MQVRLTILTVCLIKEGKKPFGDDLTYRFSFMYVLLSLNTVTEPLMLRFYKYFLCSILTFLGYRGNCEKLASKIFYTSNDY